MIYVLEVDKAQDDLNVAFGTNTTKVEMPADQFFQAVPRNSHQMVLVELAKGE